MIEIQGLSYAYHQHQRKALDGLTCTIYEGESIALVGPNGAGKSTLAKHLSGILSAQKGKIIINSRPSDPANLHELREMVGLVFQNPHDQLFCPTVQEEIEFGLTNMKMKPEEIKGKVKEAALAMHIEHLLHKPAHHLSGGEKKRVTIAAILAMQPKILIMDEPTANLDPHSEKVLTDLINSLSCTKIIISHDLPILFQTCSRILVMVNGKILEDCSVKDFMADEHLILEHGLNFRFKCKCCKVIHPERFPASPSLQDSPAVSI